MGKSAGKKSEEALEGTRPKKKRGRIRKNLQNENGAIPPAETRETVVLEAVLPEIADAVSASPMEDYVITLKDWLNRHIESFRKDIDPARAEALKNELAGFLRTGSIFAVAIVAASALLIVAELHLSGKIYANTSVGGIDVSYLAPDQARAKLLVETEQYLKTPLTFTYEDRKATLSPEELGIRFAMEQALNATPAARFEEVNPLLLAAAVVTKRDIPMQYSLDADAAFGKLEEKLNLTDKRARNARLFFKDGEFHIEPEAPGITLKESELLAALHHTVSKLRTSPLALETAGEQPRITAEELGGKKDHLTGLLKNQLTLVYDDESLKLILADHLDAVQFTEKTLLHIKGSNFLLPVSLDDAQAAVAADSTVEIVSKLEMQLAPGKIEPYLQENLIKNIEVPTSGVTVTREENGAIKIEGKGEDGKSVPKKRLIAGINLAANNGVSNVPVPVVTEKAPVNIAEDIQQLGIKELLATGHTSYYGSPPNRMHNISVGIAKYNGVLVKPGEEFSFNKILGEVDAKNGFKLEKVIKNNKAELEYGGGICQVSTTIYRAALLAGLPITERWPHTWKVSYYGQVLGHGLDATIYTGSKDIKFLNDTPGHLLIQSYVDGPHAYFKFYGTADGRKVELDGPYGGGLSYKWYRILKKNGEEIKETIISNYKPIPPPEPPPSPPPKPAAQNPAGGPTI